MTVQIIKRLSAYQDEAEVFKCSSDSDDSDDSLIRYTPAACVYGYLNFRKISRSYNKLVSLKKKHRLWRRLH